jgi:hypothetical protein
VSDEKLRLKVDVPLLHRVCAVNNSVNGGHLVDQYADLVALAQTNPERVAAIAVMLAATARERAATPDLVLAPLDKLGADLSPVAREAHRIYESFRSRGDAAIAPRWAAVGESIYSKAAGRRHRARKQEGVA